MGGQNFGWGRNLSDKRETLGQKELGADEVWAVECFQSKSPSGAGERFRPRRFVAVL